MADDKTMKLVTNLDRGAIEAKLGQVRGMAEKKGLGDLAKMFAGIEGSPKAQLTERVKNAQKWLAGKSEHGDIASVLDLVEMNLHNLK
jgi:hypothetical protein